MTMEFKASSQSFSHKLVVPLLLSFFLASLGTVVSAPVQQSSARSPREKGCYYLSTHYENGERIETNEPCLNCTCANSALMCYLRICPFVKPVGEDCIVERNDQDCCPKIWCPEVVHSNCSDTAQGIQDLRAPGCYLNGQYYEDGAQLPRDPKRPCEVCYCIRNSTSCAVQECELKVQGCTPVYREGQCCPCRYNCTYEETTTAPPGDITEDFSEGCITSGGLFVADGEAVNSSNPCEHCYCMRNEVVCAIQECQAPGDRCKPVPTKNNQCCPEKYDCPSSSESLTKTSASRKTTEIPLTFAARFTEKLEDESGSDKTRSPLESSQKDVTITSIENKTAAIGAHTHESTTSAPASRTRSPSLHQRRPILPADGVPGEMRITASVQATESKNESSSVSSQRTVPEADIEVTKITLTEENTERTVVTDSRSGFTSTVVKAQFSPSEIETTVSPTEHAERAEFGAGVASEVMSTLTESSVTKSYQLDTTVSIIFPKETSLSQEITEKEFPSPAVSTEDTTVILPSTQKTEYSSADKITQTIKTEGKEISTARPVHDAASGSSTDAGGRYGQTEELIQTPPATETSQQTIDLNFLTTEITESLGNKTELSHSPSVSASPNQHMPEEKTTKLPVANVTDSDVVQKPSYSSLSEEYSDGETPDESDLRTSPLVSDTGVSTTLEANDASTLLAATPRTGVETQTIKPFEFSQEAVIVDKKTTLKDTDAKVNSQPEVGIWIQTTESFSELTASGMQRESSSATNEKTGESTDGEYENGLTSKFMRETQTSTEFSKTSESTFTKRPLRQEAETASMTGLPEISSTGKSHTVAERTSSESVSDYGIVSKAAEQESKFPSTSEEGAYDQVASKAPERGIHDGCTLNGTEYKDGEKVNSADPCEYCFCSDNQVTCVPVICKVSLIPGCFLLPPDDEKCCSEVALCEQGDGTTVRVPLKPSDEPQETDSLSSKATYQSSTSIKETTAPTMDPKQSGIYTVTSDISDGIREGSSIPVTYDDIPSQSVQIKLEDAETETDIFVTEASYATSAIKQTKETENKQTGAFMSSSSVVQIATHDSLEGTANSTSGPTATASVKTSVSSATSVPTEEITRPTEQAENTTAEIDGTGLAEDQKQTTIYHRSGNETRVTESGERQNEKVNLVATSSPATQTEKFTTYVRKGTVVLDEREHPETSSTKESTATPTARTTVVTRSQSGTGYDQTDETEVIVTEEGQMLTQTSRESEANTEMEKDASMSRTTKASEDKLEVTSDKTVTTNGEAETTQKTGTVFSTLLPVETESATDALKAITISKSQTAGETTQSIKLSEITSTLGRSFTAVEAFTESTVKVFAENGTTDHVKGQETAEEVNVQSDEKYASVDGTTNLEDSELDQKTTVETASYEAPQKQTTQVSQKMEDITDITLSSLHADTEKTTEAENELQFLRKTVLPTVVAFTPTKKETLKPGKQGATSPSEESYTTTEGETESIFDPDSSETHEQQTWSPVDDDEMKEHSEDSKETESIYSTIRGTDWRMASTSQRYVTEIESIIAENDLTAKVVGQTISAEEQSFTGGYTAVDGKTKATTSPTEESVTKQQSVSRTSSEIALGTEEPLPQSTTTRTQNIYTISETKTSEKLQTTETGHTPTEEGTSISDVHFAYTTYDVVHVTGTPASLLRSGNHTIETTAEPLLQTEFKQEVTDSTKQSSISTRESAQEKITGGSDDDASSLKLMTESPISFSTGKRLEPEISTTKERDSGLELHSTSLASDALFAPEFSVTKGSVLSDHESADKDEATKIFQQADISEPAHSLNEKAPPVSQETSKPVEVSHLFTEVTDANVTPKTFSTTSKKVFLTETEFERKTTRIAEVVGQVAGSVWTDGKQTDVRVNEKESSPTESLHIRPTVEYEDVYTVQQHLEKHPYTSSEELLNSTTDRSLSAEYNASTTDAASSFTSVSSSLPKTAEEKLFEKTDSATTATTLTLQELWGVQNTLSEVVSGHTTVQNTSEPFFEREITKLPYKEISTKDADENEIVSAKSQEGQMVTSGQEHFTDPKIYTEVGTLETLSPSHDAIQTVMADQQGNTLAFAETLSISTEESKTYSYPEEQAKDTPAVTTNDTEELHVETESRDRTDAGLLMNSSIPDGDIGGTESSVSEMLQEGQPEKASSVKLGTTATLTLATKVAAQTLSPEENSSTTVIDTEAGQDKETLLEGVDTQPVTKITVEAVQATDVSPHTTIKTEAHETGSATLFTVASEDLTRSGSEGDDFTTGTLTEKPRTTPRSAEEKGTTFYPSSYASETETRVVHKSTTVLLKEVTHSDGAEQKSTAASETVKPSQDLTFTWPADTTTHRLPDRTDAEEKATESSTSVTEKPENRSILPEIPDLSDIKTDIAESSEQIHGANTESYSFYISTSTESSTYSDGKTGAPSSILPSSASSIFTEPELSERISPDEVRSTDEHWEKRTSLPSTSTRFTEQTGREGDEQTASVIDFLPFGTSTVYGSAHTESETYATTLFPRVNVSQATYKSVFSSAVDLTTDIASTTFTLLPPLERTTLEPRTVSKKLAEVTRSELPDSSRSSEIPDSDGISLLPEGTSFLPLFSETPSQKSSVHLEKDISTTYSSAFDVQTAEPDYSLTEGEEQVTRSIAESSTDTMELDSGTLKQTSPQQVLEGVTKKALTDVEVTGLHEAITSTSSAQVLEGVTKKALPDVEVTGLHEDITSTSSAQVLEGVTKKALPDVEATGLHEDITSTSSAQVLEGVTKKALSDVEVTGLHEDITSTSSAQVLEGVTKKALPDVEVTGLHEDITSTSSAQVLEGVTKKALSDVEVTGLHEDITSTFSAQVLEGVTKKALPDVEVTGLYEDITSTSSAQVLEGVTTKALPDVEATGLHEDITSKSSAQVLEGVTKKALPDVEVTGLREDITSTSSAQVLEGVTKKALPDVEVTGLHEDITSTSSAQVLEGVTKKALPDVEVTGLREDITSTSSAQVLEGVTKKALPDVEVTGLHEDMTSVTKQPELKSESDVTTVRDETSTEQSNLRATSISAAHNQSGDHQTTVLTLKASSDDTTLFFSTTAIPPQENQTSSSSMTTKDHTTVTDEDLPFPEEGYCFFEGQVFHSAEQIPRSDPCEFCFCFRSDIICLQQTCPPPIKGCYATPIRGFCCPRFQCPVQESQLNISTTTTTTKRPKYGNLEHKTVPVTGCEIDGVFYRAGQVVRPASGPCIECRCEFGGMMKCDPQDCQPQAPLLFRMNRKFFSRR